MLTKQGRHLFTRFDNNSTQAALASAADCAALSLDVYYDVNDPNRPSLPENWKEFLRYQCDGYAGVCYVRNADNSQGPDSIVFAHRGTILNFQVLKSDLEIALNKVPCLYEQAQYFSKKAVKKLIKTYAEKLKKAEWIQTGHSLGGVFADLLSGGRFVRTITFENPGSKPIIENLYRELYKQAGFPKEEIDKIIAQLLATLQKTCQSFQADVNFINTCNEQVGNVWKLSDLPYNHNVLDGPILNISSSYYLNPHYAAYSIDQHHIINIYNYLKANGKVEGANYPFGFMNGYIAYLDGKERKTYWESYFETLWQKFPGLQEQYHYNYQEFYQFWTVQLERTRQQAIEQRNFEALHNSKSTTTKTQNESYHVFNIFAKPKNFSANSELIKPTSEFPVHPQQKL